VDFLNRLFKRISNYHVREFAAKKILGKEFVEFLVCNFLFYLFISGSCLHKRGSGDRVTDESI
jgi:hypothetical protein